MGGQQDCGDGDNDCEGDWDAAAAASVAPPPHLGLQLIDFGRAVDLELLPPGCQLRGDSGTDAFRCVEMREGGAWLWQADAHGVAATVHTLLYGRYMEVERVRDNATGAGRRRGWRVLLCGRGGARGAGVAPRAGGT